MDIICVLWSENLGFLSGLYYLFMRFTILKILQIFQQHRSSEAQKLRSYSIPCVFGLKNLEYISEASRNKCKSRSLLLMLRHFKRFHTFLVCIRSGASLLLNSLLSFLENLWCLSVHMGIQLEWSMYISIYHMTHYHVQTLYGDII
jgi:hypothetical protein